MPPNATLDCFCGNDGQSTGCSTISRRPNQRPFMGADRVRNPMKSCPDGIDHTPRRSNALRIALGLKEQEINHE